MALHQQTGTTGEQLGVEYLQQQGFQILHCNWRYSRYEVDVIAGKNNILHFIEIKTRRSKRFGNPEDRVTKAKMNHLALAAEQFLHLHPQWQRIQFNILAIYLPKTTAPEFLLIEDVNV